MALGPDRQLSPARLSLRVAVLGGCAVALFAILFFRLWNLQVLDGDEYLAEAKNNRAREYKVIAPRGNILDRNGEVLVENRTTLALQVNTAKLPADVDQRRAELAALGELAGMPLKKVRRTIRESGEEAPGAPVTLRRDVEEDLVYFLEENGEEYPGVSIQRVFVRDYPNGSEAAHVLGAVGEVTGEELEERRFAELEPGDEVGKGGIEETYDRFLRGEPGFTRVQVDAFGQPTPGGALVNQPPAPGDNLKLTLDQNVQRAGEAALGSYGLPGAFITMDARSGEVLALGSAPTYDPTVFTKPLTQAQVDELVRNETAPLTDRVTEGHYPVGSTFKMITALAGLESGSITPSESIVDSGFIMVGDQRFQNAEGAAYGSVDLHKSLQVSSDVYYYLLGAEMNRTEALQRWARRLGLGEPSGIDLPGEQEGLIPDPAWRNQLFEQEETEREWAVGDNIQLAIGQGDLQTSPLQMAIAYAALGNGGTLVTPHLGLEIEDAAGRVIDEFEVEPRRKVKFAPRHRDAILEGLHAAAQVPGGTSYGTFGDFPVPIAGKTGTAERPPNGEMAWYAALAPYPNPRIVTVVGIEEGGYGADTAAPVALDILEAYFGREAGESETPEGEAESEAGPEAGAAGVGVE